MSEAHDVTDDIVYDLVSIQYHALQAADSYKRYLEDAHSTDHPEITEFIKSCKEQDEHRARRCHQLLGELGVRG